MTTASRGLERLADRVVLEPLRHASSHGVTDAFIKDRQPGVALRHLAASARPPRRVRGAGRDHSGRTRPHGGGWREIEVSGKKANQFVGHPDGSIEVISSSSVSRLYRPVEVDLKATPELTWQWRVDQPVPPTDLTRKGKTTPR